MQPRLTSHSSDATSWTIGNPMTVPESCSPTPLAASLRAARNGEPPDGRRGESPSLAGLNHATRKRRQLGRPSTATRGAGHGNVVERRAGRHTAEQEPAAAHVTPADEGGRKFEARAEDKIGRASCRERV